MGGEVLPETVVDGKFVIERVLGRGGMGTVYAAHDTTNGTRAAIKLLHPELASNAKVVARFVREARVASRIDSAHVARVLEWGVWAEGGGVPYIAFELLSGVDLAELLAARGPLPIPTAVDYVMQALLGVASAHMQGIAHRDLKPSNLFCVDRGPDAAPLVKVLDFGIAKALKGAELFRGPDTSTSGLVGSPLYMSPEQLRSSKNVDARADIWSLGVILFELLGGTTPFRAESLGQLLTSVMEGEPTPLATLRPEAPPALWAVLRRCLERERERRYMSVRELGVALAPFGSEAAKACLVEIQYVFNEETAPRFTSDPSLPSALDATLSDDGSGPRLPLSSSRGAETHDLSRRRTKSAPTRLPLVAAGGVTLLVLAGVVGYFFGTR